MTTIYIRPTGEMYAIYTDTFPWRQLGRPTIRRASNVEPDNEAHWSVDLTPIQRHTTVGPFQTRHDALAFENTIVQLIIEYQTLPWETAPCTSIPSTPDHTVPSVPPPCT